MKNKKWFLVVVSIALILAGILAILSVVKGDSLGSKACPINETAIASCNATTLTGSSITGGVIGTLQSGGIITGIVALFVVALGAVILINTMRSQEQ